MGICLDVAALGVVLTFIVYGRGIDVKRLSRGRRQKKDA